MKRGQMTAVVVIILIVAAVFGVLIYSQKKAGKSISQEIPRPAVEEKPVDRVVYRVPETTQAPPPTMAPTIAPPPVQAPAQVQEPEAPKPCIAQVSASTCYAARSLAQKKCPRGYICKPTSIGSAAEGCYMEITCMPPGAAGIKEQKSYQEQVGTQKQPYAEGYYRQPPSSGSLY